MTHHDITQNLIKHQYYMQIYKPELDWPCTSHLGANWVIISARSEITAPLINYRTRSK